MHRVGVSLSIPFYPTRLRRDTRIHNHRRRRFNWSAAAGAFRPPLINAPAAHYDYSTRRCAFRSTLTGFPRITTIIILSRRSRLFFYKYFLHARYTLVTIIYTIYENITWKSWPCRVGLWSEVTVRWIFFVFWNGEKQTRLELQCIYLHTCNIYTYTIYSERETMPSAAVAGKDGFRVSDGAREGRSSSESTLRDLRRFVPTPRWCPFGAHCTHNTVNVAGEGDRHYNIYEDETWNDKTM